MVRQFENQTRLLTCLVTRLIPWILLSLLAIGAGCGDPSPWLQVDFDLPAGKKVPLQKVDVFVTFTATKTQTTCQGKGTTYYMGQERSEDKLWVRLPPGTPGLFSVSVTATTYGPHGECFGAQTDCGTEYPSDGHRNFEHIMHLKEEPCVASVPERTPDASCGVSGGTATNPDQRPSCL